MDCLKTNFKNLKESKFSFYDWKKELPRNFPPISHLENFSFYKHNGKFAHIFCCSLWDWAEVKFLCTIKKKKKEKKKIPLKLMHGQCVAFWQSLVAKLMYFS